MKSAHIVFSAFCSFIIAIFVFANCKDNRQQQPVNEPNKTQHSDYELNAYERALQDSKKSQDYNQPRVHQQPPPIPQHVEKPDVPDKPPQNPWEQPEGVNYKHLLNKASVEKALDEFFQSIEDENQEKFIGFFNFDWMMETTALYLKMNKEQMIEFFDVKEMKKALSYYNRTINPKYADMYFSRDLGTMDDNEVGYGVYNMTPKGDVGKEFEMSIKLKVDAKSLSWKIVELSWPNEYRKLYQVPVVLIKGNVYELWEFRLPPEEYVKFSREIKKDESYIPPMKYKFQKIRDLDEEVEFDPDEIIDEDGPTKQFTIPDLLEDIVLTRTEENMIDRVMRGYRGSGNEFKREHYKRNVIAALINIIIVGIKNGFKIDDEKNSAMEANLALQNIFDKTSARDRLEYSLRIGIISTESLREAVEVANKWLELFKSEGWK